MAFDHVEVKDLDDVGMAQLADHHRLALETLERMRVLVIIVAEYLHCNFAL